MRYVKEVVEARHGDPQKHPGEQETDRYVRVLQGFPAAFRFDEEETRKKLAETAMTNGDDVLTGYDMLCMESVNIMSRFDKEFTAMLLTSMCEHKGYVRTTLHDEDGLEYDRVTTSSTPEIVWVMKQCAMYLTHIGTLLMDKSRADHPVADLCLILSAIIKARGELLRDKFLKGELT